MNEKDIKTLVGLKIKNYRNSAKYTQEQLCNLINIDISGLSKIENGKNFPSFETLFKLFSILKIMPAEFFDFVETKDFESNKDSILVAEKIKGLSQKEKLKVLKFIDILID